MIRITENYGDKVINFVIDVESKEVAREIVNFCWQTAKISIEVDSPQKAVYKAIDDFATRKGYSLDVLKTLYRTYGKWVMVIQHPEWF